jgi:hypothetical protein
MRACVVVTGRCVLKEKESERDSQSGTQKNFARISPVFVQFAAPPPGAVTHRAPALGRAELRLDEARGAALREVLRALLLAAPHRLDLERDELLELRLERALFEPAPFVAEVERAARHLAFNDGTHSLSASSVLLLSLCVFSKGLRDFASPRSL